MGSETGTTIGFAQLFQEQLNKIGVKSYIEELNRFGSYPNMTHLLVFTATYGQGEVPTNAKKFGDLIQNAKIDKPFEFSVVG